MLCWLGHGCGPTIEALLCIAQLNCRCQVPIRRRPFAQAQALMQSYNQGRIKARHGALAFRARLCRSAHTTAHI